ncbi:conserved hypothetical protein [Talaromyces stipitatus ATCC 10500]|uniref:Transposase Tc1-like domain-containing protein n=1 Tax=Talaromyces stipitatus (strain ATCC 10500 / CBS 375.48 / QM 6759 / NRRL 1006) TaxID=441959 RepID=B8MTT0_TALSN|nr:uncharacterized protein TSTA_005950 [Talaromyces stipitatus ATCC 10500]EED12565.1 conserved hypothetical protein [Talaromyces stipitatus ATCC 10500]
MSEPTNEPTKEPPNMSTNESTNEPASPKQYSTRLTRDDRIRVQTLREAGFTYEQIAKQLNITQNQVQYACQSSQVTPKKARGAPPKLSEAQMDEIIESIFSSKRNRCMSYHKVIKALNLNVAPTTLAYSLKKRGYIRCKALRKPYLSPENRRQRLIWALEHIQWTFEQWKQPLWTDETWVTSGSHTLIYVTRKAGEELDDTCEKEWNSINAERYCERTVPLIDGYLRLMRQEGLYLQLMQDGAPGHSSSFTKEELHSRGIYPILYPDDEELSYDQLREVVRAAWDAVPESFLIQLIHSMQARCQAVIAADGGNIPY